jgi:hypothetical protein
MILMVWTYLSLGGVYVTCQFCPLSFCCAGVLHGHFSGFQSFLYCFNTSLVSGSHFYYVLVLWVAWGHLYLWPMPLLALAFNHGKTTPGGGRGSRSPPISISL